VVGAVILMNIRVIKNGRKNWGEILLPLLVGIDKTSLMMKQSLSRI
jgi:hypothetical protein